MNRQKETIFGIHAITEAIIAGEDTISKIWVKNTIKHVALKKLLDLALRHRIPYSKVPLVKLNRLTKGNHQGAIAFISPIAFANLDHVLQTTYEKGKSPLVVLVDQLQDVHNLGAIARTALATNVDALIIGTKRTVPISGDVMKASAGALAHIPVCRVTSLGETIQYLQHSGLQVVACTEKAGQSLYETNLVPPIAFLLGGESKGIATQHLQIADIKVKIPMSGPILSLNVSVAAAIVLYEAVRQHRLQ